MVFFSLRVLVFCMTLPNHAFYSGLRRIDVLGANVNIDEFHATFFDDDDTLECCHSYVQWLFPIDAQSRFNDACAPLCRLEAQRIARTVTPSARLLYSFRLMLRFYGFILRDGIIEIDLARERRLTHLNLSSHNWMRVTRILRCLSLCGMGELAREWLRALHIEVFETRRVHNASSSFRSYWENAALTPSDADASNDRWPIKNMAHLLHRTHEHTRIPMALKALANAYIANPFSASLAHMLRSTARRERPRNDALVLGLATSKKIFCLVPKRAAVFVLKLSSMRLSIVCIATIRVQCLPRESESDENEWSFDQRSGRTGFELYSMLRRSSPLGGTDYLPCGVHVL